MFAPNRFLPLFLAAVGTVILAPAAFAAPAGGSYAGPIDLAGASRSARYQLDRVEVGAKQVTLRLTLHNAASTTVSFSCPSKTQAAAAEVVIDAAGRQQKAIDSYCQRHPSTKFPVKAGADFKVTGVFPADGWTENQFVLSWYGATSGELTLDGSRITRLKSVAADSRDDPSWALWAGLGLLAILLVVASIWMRLLFRRGRFLVSVGAAGGAWLLGVRAPWALLAAATGAAVLVVVFQMRFWGSDGGWAGGSGGYSGGARGGAGWAGDSGSHQPGGSTAAGSGWSSQSAEEGPLDRSFYGNGPQHGTSRPADEPGSMWGDGPQHGTSTPFTEPGGFYSDRPFGST